MLDAFFEDLARNPDDWQLRAVMADWCEDNGQGDRAVCLRWMIAHNKRPYSGSSATFTRGHLLQLSMNHCRSFSERNAVPRISAQLMRSGGIGVACTAASGSSLDSPSFTQPAQRTIAMKPMMRGTARLPATITYLRFRPRRAQG